MNAIILAGGYATRLHPLTENVPKPLLKVAGKPMMEHIIRKLEELNLNKIYVVTNDKFYNKFEAWLHMFDAKIPMEVINDGTKIDDDRLGALGDLHFTIKNKNIDDDTLVIAGDNLFELSLKEVTQMFSKWKHNLIVLYDVKKKELASNYGVVETKDNIVVDFEEKPLNPQSTLVSTGIYFFPKKTINIIEKYISQKNNPDKTGDFIKWLYKREIVYAYTTDKKWYDIGSFEQLEEANKIFRG
jgi:glucose-1-phosphate thymidylyltransferase